VKTSEVYSYAFAKFFHILFYILCDLLSSVVVNCGLQAHRMLYVYRFC